MIERPDSCPKPGQVEQFDAGWDAHKAGISRETVRVIQTAVNHPSMAGWATMAWDIREMLSNE